MVVGAAEDVGAAVLVGVDVAGSVESTDVAGAAEVKDGARVSGAPVVLAKATAVGLARSGEGRVVTSSRTLDTAEVVSTIEASVAASQARAVTSFLRMFEF